METIRYLLNKILAETEDMNPSWECVRSYTLRILDLINLKLPEDKEGKDSGNP